jgi:hypothetical protein
MSWKPIRLTTLLGLLCGASLAAQTIPVTNWKTPPLKMAATSDISGATPFIAVTPCRVVDTRNANGTYGGPSLPANGVRSFPIPGGPCSGIPAAAAYSFNFTIANYHVGGGGFLTAYPTGSARPFVSTLNFGDGPPLANAAIVPASNSGSIDVYVSNSTHVIIDINGYYPDTRANLNGGEQLSLIGTVGGSGLIRAENLSTSTSIFTSAIRGVADGAVANVAGVFGESSGSGANYGVKGVNDAGSLESAGVLGYSVGRTNYDGSNGSFYRAGVRGEADPSSNGIGVLGVSSYVGVGGDLTDSSTGDELAEGQLAVTGPWAVYAHGDIGATGTKSFLDPHPTDASKVIRYVSLEGPEAGTYFRGRGRFVNRQAIIDIPENFRMVTEEEGLTVHITPMGGIASVGVTSVSLQQIVAESTKDLEFSYVVYGVRKGYANFEPVVDGTTFVPRGPSAKMPAWLNASQKQRLIDNGTYNPDGTVNLKTALRLGWDKAWGQK